MAGLCAIEAHCLLHNDIHTRDVGRGWVSRHHRPRRRLELAENGGSDTYVRESGRHGLAGGERRRISGVSGREFVVGIVTTTNPWLDSPNVTTTIREEYRPDLRCRCTIWHCVSIRITQTELVFA